MLTKAYHDYSKREIWHLDGVPLLCDHQVGYDARDIRQNIGFFLKAAEHFKLPEPHAFISNVTPAVYLAWIELEDIENDYQDPHIAQYRGSWSKVTLAELRDELKRLWRPDSERKPLQEGMGPGWKTWSQGKPVPWRDLHE